MLNGSGKWQGWMMTFESDWQLDLKYDVYSVLFDNSKKHIAYFSNLQNTYYISDYNAQMAENVWTCIWKTSRQINYISAILRTIIYVHFSREYLDHVLSKSWVVPGVVHCLRAQVDPSSNENWWYPQPFGFRSAGQRSLVHHRKPKLRIERLKKTKTGKLFRSFFWVWSCLTSCPISLCFDRNGRCGLKWDRRPLCWNSRKGQ